MKDWTGTQFGQFFVPFFSGILLTLLAGYYALGGNININISGEGREEAKQVFQPEEFVEKISGGCIEFSDSSLPGESGWENGLKTLPQPANCLVKGFAIEKLEPELNYRRGYAVAHTRDVKNRDHLFPYFLASHDLSLQTRKRKIYLDLGATQFITSFAWFVYVYPLDFTEYHVFESNGLFEIPEYHQAEDETVQPMDAGSQVRSRVCPITNKILNNLNLYESVVADYDGTMGTEKDLKVVINITRFIKEELNVTKDDALIVKMDIEGAEYPILKAWLNDPTMSEIVDELFVELHYKHPSMKVFGWDRFTNKTREEANTLMVKLRENGVYVHPWP